ncbi:dihydrodipicolinate reductase [Sphingobium sufflavum]|uniref:NAD(P)H-dependent amine dehydrogenase family protein n=1 Tax=Sphingobium sufflavum TaxID=1129547 RepID=UPI001F2E7A02|nr:dihydrodipicolinate reductase [Sphingobium sufflavum]MCE7798470.1 dihydrodipicolinate reductase [Sphingobium sufflavum]
MAEETVVRGRHGARWRVVQWATGNVGSRALRRVIEHPDLELVGVWVHGAAKVGKDAGELAGTAPTGIRATGRMEDILALRADCVLYFPHVMNYDEVVRILESGANIITTRTEFQNPATMDPAIRARVEAACAKGNSSIHGTGSSPGFITEAMPIVLTSLQRRLDCLTIYEFAPSESRNSPEMLFGYMGFGSKPDGPNRAILDFKRETFSGTLSLIADAIGLPLDEIRATGALGIARNDVHIIAGTVPQGTVAATKTTIEGMRDGKPLLRMVANWSVSSDVDTTDGEEWEFRESGWRVVVEGDCPMKIDIVFPVAPDDYAAMTPGLTAHRPVNMIRYVCEAPAGIRTTVDLPQVIAQLG